VQTAKQVVLNLTDISGDTAPQDIDRVLAVASGDLKVEYTQRKDAYAQVIQQAKVKATGEVIEAALENEDAHNAVVLVAAKQTLTNAGSPGPQQRYYRFRITVARDDSGQMTGSKVEFVA
jgi:Mce-associated membrane protein